MSTNYLLYPNPFITETTLMTNNILRNATVRLYNSIGQDVEHIANISGHQLTIFKKDLPTGIYFLHLKEENGNWITEKLIISD